MEKDQNLTNRNIQNNNISGKTGSHDLLSHPIFYFRS